jgi:hypothetical protein
MPSSRTNLGQSPRLPITMIGTVFNLRQFLAHAPFHVKKIFIIDPNFAEIEHHNLYN